ncbi:MAG TPA: CDP-alcohol phosphatidyltransferase family protein [Kofleriaceae bacterium]|nr:CDP-alcohol phosphatidyltransferase family protein [Kofleriaceae bacterium]
MMSAPASDRRVVSPFNPANAVTASRFLTLPPFVWAVANGYHQWATLFMLICGLLDKVDGAVAKIFDCRSQFGEIFDAITDGICYGFALIIVAYYNWAPAIPVALILLMGVANTGLRLAYSVRAKRPTNYKSYAMERVVGYTAYLIGFATGAMEVHLFYWAFVPLQALVIAYDAKRMLVDPIPPAPEAA